MRATGLECAQRFITAPTNQVRPVSPVSAHLCVPQRFVCRAFARAPLPLFFLLFPSSFSSFPLPPPVSLFLLLFRAVADLGAPAWAYEMVQRGLYAEWLAPFLDHLRHRLFVLASEELFAHPDATMARVAAFLGLAPIDWRPIAARVHAFAADDAVIVRSADAPTARMDPETRASLQAYFAPHNAALAALLDREGIPVSAPWLRRPP